MAKEKVGFPAFSYFVMEIFNPSTRNNFNSVARFGVVWNDSILATED